MKRLRTIRGDINGTHNYRFAGFNYIQSAKYKNLGGNYIL